MTLLDTPKDNFIKAATDKSIIVSTPLPS